MRDHGQETGFCTVGRLGQIPRFRQGAFSLDPVGDIATDALHLHLIPGADDHFAPRDPTFALGRCYFLVAYACSIGKQRGLGLLQNG